MRKKILLSIILSLLAVIIAAITIYTLKYSKNAPVLEVKEQLTVMEYSTVPIEDFIIRTENVRSIEIVDVKLTRPNNSGEAGISDGGQSVRIGDFWESYIVTIEAVGTNGWKVRKSVSLTSYQEPPEYAN